MNYKLLTVALLTLTSFSFAQQNRTFWKQSAKTDVSLLKRNLNLPEKTILDLDLVAIKTTLLQAPQRNETAKTSNVILSLPDSDGTLERFKVYESSNMDVALASRYPDIKSYIGIGIDNPTATAYFSLSPLGFKSMVIYADKSAVFIEPISQDLITYSVYKKSDKIHSLSHFECSVIDSAKPKVNTSVLRPNADDGTLRTFRLAMSVTGEYTT